ncbi:hypothetical protein V3C99_009455 [Haemonchus contortus]
MNPTILFALFCVAYSVAKKCSQIEYEKFGKFNESYSKSYKLPKLLKRFDGDDLVLEFPEEEHDDDMITRNYFSFLPTVVLSRQDKRPIYLMHGPSKPEVANVSVAEFIDSLHVCKSLQDHDSE